MATLEQSSFVETDSWSVRLAAASGRVLAQLLPRPGPRVSAEAGAERHLIAERHREAARRAVDRLLL